MNRLLMLVLISILASMMTCSGPTDKTTPTDVTVNETIPTTVTYVLIAMPFFLLLIIFIKICLQRRILKKTNLKKQNSIIHRCESCGQKSNFISLSPAPNNIKESKNLQKDSLPTSEYQCSKKESVQYDKIDSLPRNTSENEYIYIDPKENQNKESENAYYSSSAPRVKSEPDLTRLSVSPGTSHRLFKKSMEAVNRDEIIRADKFASYVTVAFNAHDKTIYKSPSSVPKFPPPLTLPKKKRHISIDPKDNQNKESEDVYYTGGIPRAKSEPGLTRLNVSPGTSHRLFKKSIEAVNRDERIRADNFASYVTVNAHDQTIYKAPSNVPKFQPPLALLKNIQIDSYIRMDGGSYDSSSSIYQPFW